jgi:DNA adenine methylase
MSYNLLVLESSFLGEFMLITQPARPFLKWAGGKSQLLPILRQYYPVELGKTVTRYIEPFIGGGAVFFDVLNNYEIEYAYISDVNLELINTYNAIKYKCSDLVEYLAQMEAKYSQLDLLARKKIYYDKRDEFNSIKLVSDRLIDLRKAGLFIFLNKTCFNGLYRVNRSGQFNVPMGDNSKPIICDHINLHTISTLLSRVEIVHGNYKQCESFANNHTFMYIDPPYRPISVSSSFTAYTHEIFDDDSQRELANFITQMSNRGVYIMSSNSDPQNTDPNDTFFDELYGAFKVNRILASRMINSRSSGRGKLSEVLVTTY